MASIAPTNAYGHPRWKKRLKAAVTPSNKWRLFDTCRRRTLRTCTWGAPCTCSRRSSCTC